MQIVGLRSLPLNAFVVGVGALGVLCLVGWPIAVFAAISVIGLPIFVLMAAIPTLALAVVSWRLSFVGLARMGFRSAIASAIVAAIAMTLPPAVYNARTEDRVTTLVKDDKAEAVPATRGLVVALRDGLRSRDAVCGDLCRRLLLTGAATKVLVDPAGFKADQPATPATPAVSFRLATGGGTCPDVTIQDNGPVISIPAERQTGRSAELMRVALVEGRCLVSEPARLGDAAVVVSEGMVADGKSPAGAGLSISADTVRARRLALHVVENGALVERHRRTAVLFAPLVPVLVPTYVGLSGLELKPAFLRSPETRNAWKGQLSPDWVAFFAQTLRIDLSLAGVGRPAPVATAKALLAREGALPKAGQAIANDLFNAVIMQNRMDAEQAEAALALLRDERVPVPYTAWAAVRFGPAVRPGYAGEVADVLFDRLRKLARGPAPAPPRSLRDEGHAIAGAIAALPDDEIRRRRDDLVWLAGDPVMRVHGYTALRRLSALGRDAVPVILTLLDAAAAQRAAGAKDIEAWQHPYLAGMTALCTMKTEGAAALPAVIALLERRAMPGGGSYGRLGLTTLVALGAEPAKARDVMLTAGIEPETVDKQLAFAQRRSDCSY